MKRDQIVLLCHQLAAAVAVGMLAGCTSLKQASDSIVHVTATRNPAKASRLTWAGVKAFRVGALEQALNKFSAAIAVDDSYGPAHNNLGLLLYEQGNLYDAILSFENAMDSMPDDPTVYYNLALALESAGKTFEALDLYQQAVEMDPANPIFLGNLVRLRVRLGEHDPSLVAQLQDLVLLETRPTWRRWADGQLALFFNDVLDRGPEVPDFNTGSDQARQSPSESSGNRVIDLTPPASPQLLPEQSKSETPGGSQPRFLSGPEMNPTAETEVLPAPVADGDALELEDSSAMPAAADYFQ